MKSSYKKLGTFIKEVIQKNSDLKISTLLGVSITKKFIPSVANTVGTDMSNYKIVRQNQFAYGPVTSRNGDKISVALLKDESCIVSTSYTVFEIIDLEKLDPDYLMMWFKREEFDRYARFKSHGSVRELFDWTELCNVELPVPDIEIQRKIVNSYKILQDRISINSQLLDKLEQKAENLYKRWFIDFEFPISNSSLSNNKSRDVTGKNYKSNGGVFVLDQLTGLEVPLDWQFVSFETALNFKTGKLNSNASVENGAYPFFTCSSETFKTDTYSFDTEAVLLAGNNASAIYPLKYYAGKFDVYQRTYVITSLNKNISIPHIYFQIKSELESFKGVSSGTTTKFLTMELLNSLKIICPTEEVAVTFERLTKPLFSYMLNLQKNNELLKELEKLLLQRMSLAENE